MGHRPHIVKVSLGISLLDLEHLIFLRAHRSRHLFSPLLRQIEPYQHQGYMISLSNTHKRFLLRYLNHLQQV